MADRNKILATIARTAFAFTGKYPDKRIYLKGVDTVRTRLYQMAINHAYNELSQEFKIFGNVSEHPGKYDLQPFKTGINYSGFFVEKR